MGEGFHYLYMYKLREVLWYYTLSESRSNLLLAEPVHRVPPWIPGGPSASRLGVVSRDVPG